MAGYKIDRAGIKYKKLLVISYSGKKGRNHMWNCVCNCGSHVIVSGNNLHSGQESCSACARKRTVKSRIKSNSFIVCGDVAHVSVPSGNNKYTMLIDLCDLCLVQDGLGNWAGTKTRGGKVYVKRGVVTLHRVINNTPKGMLTDHISGDTLDNRRENLRSVTYQENNRNSAIGKANCSGVVGVGFHKATGKWRVRINGDNKKLIEIGYFDDISKAIAARKEAEVKYGYHKNHGRDGV